MSEQHGMTGCPEWRAWRNMKRRCDSPCRQDYHRYGGRGIKVCERWRDSFLAFYEDMGPRPSDQHTLERVDNDGNYEPSNCVWKTRKEQGQNRCNCRYLTYRGETRTISEWADVTGINQATIQSRVKKQGWGVEKALTTPPKSQV